MTNEIAQKKNEALPKEVVAVYEDCVRVVEAAKEWFKLNYKRDKKRATSKELG